MEANYYDIYTSLTRIYGKISFPNGKISRDINNGSV